LVQGRYDSQPVTRRLKRGLVVAALAATAATFGTAGGSAAVTTRLVDDDNAQCPNALYNAVGDALADASDGDTIIVCPGDYTGEGNIVVDKRLSLVGYTGKVVNMATCADDTGHTFLQPSSNSVVQSFQVEHNLVSIRNFTIDSAPEFGVLIPAGVSRATVFRNVIQHASIGVNLNGSTSMVYTNCIRDNNAGGSASGTGVYSDQGLTASTIDQNLFFGNDSAAITLLDTAGPGSLDDNRVTNNVSVQDGDLLSVAGATNSKISGNSSSASGGAAVFLQSGALADPNSGLEITNNKLTNGMDIGINVDDDALVNSTIKSNTAKGNASLGILVQAAGNMNNTITKNDFRGNFGPVDCADLTSGSGTAGTANTWKKDKGLSSFPVGICKK
jgi:parallel beta-helix repeat protein